ncbi:hypothetical protein E1A91_A02G013700v1 [Gossypium mustelinum]|uniref:BED-type domain-containing protein n=1 Tax=Gossypium mustelinum TaxID=34275 RepID=A0A5D3A2I9_GOSMU|nr:hypothetical protein E1A91_A02G013700v1 [Gossypium mustelinum]
MASSSSFSSADAALEILVSCAHAIEDGNLKTADSFLHQIWNTAAVELDLISKLVRYFAEALVRRAYGLHPPYYTHSNLQIPHPLYYYYYYSRFDINEMVGEAIESATTGKKGFHLIDFHIPHLYGRGYLFKTLPNRSSDPLSVRITVVLPTFLKNTVDFQEEMEYLTEAGKLLKIELKKEDLRVVYANSLGEVDESTLDLRRTNDDEALVVYYNFKFHTLLAEAEAMKKELIKLRQINPEIVIMQEQYANDNDGNFIKRLEYSFRYYSNFFQYYSNLFKSGKPLGDNTAKYYMRQIHNIVACEGRDRIMRHQSLDEWRDLLLTAGFLQIPFQKDVENLHALYWVEEIKEEKGCLVLSHKDCPILFVSCWRPRAGEEHFKFNLNSNKLGQGFNPRPFQPFPEGFILNRLATFAEIYDMLEDVCFRYELPVALTWACEATTDKIMLDGKKHTLFMERTSCYASNEGSQCFMEACAKHHIQEGQAIAGKAFQSSANFHFEPSITKLMKSDYPLFNAAQLFGSHAVVAICLQNHYIIGDVYVVEFYWPEIESEKSESLTLDIFNDLKNMKKKFVTIRVGGNEVGFEREAISTTLQGTMHMRNAQPASSTNDLLSSNTTWSLNAVQPCDVHEMERHGLVEQTCKVPRTKRRKYSSKVWLDFDKFEVNGKQVAKCKHCNKDFTGSSKSGTTHLKNHLERCQSKKIKNQERQLITSEIGDLITRDSDESNFTFDQERSRLDFAKMIIKHQSPLDMAEQEFFKIFMKNLQPMFEFQSKDILLSDIHRIYKEEKEKLQLYFDHLACNFNLTISLCKNNHGKTAYCCLIAHFIDDNWEPRMKIIACKPLEHIYDTKALNEIIQSSVLEWNISKKVFSITMDNPYLNDDMFQKIKETCFSDQGSFPSTHWFIGCTFIEDGFREMDLILLKLRKSIEYVSEIAEGKLKFEEVVNQVKLQGGKSWDDLSLRLDSDFGVLHSALESREIFCQLEKIDGNFKLNPSVEEWEMVLAFHSCLKCFDDIEGTQSLTANLYFPKLCNICKKFLHLEKSNYPIVTLMKRKFDYYWSLCNSAFAVATILDPRLKFKFVEFSYTEIYGHDSKMHLNRFHKVLTDVYYEYANEARNLSKSTSDLDDSNSSTTEIVNDCILESFSKFASANNFNEVASWKSELDCYLDEPLLPLDGAFDLLYWWCINNKRFPTLAKMARDFLAMPIPILAPCLNFNAMITNPTYNNLNTESMEALVCSQNWLKIPKENDGENHGPMQNMYKRKRKMEDHSNVVKVSKYWNREEANSSGDIAKGSIKNENIEASVCNQNRLEISTGKPNHGRNITALIEIPEDDSPFSNNKSGQFQSLSSESDNETTLKEEGSWCKEDVRAYLVSRFTGKENKRLNRWQTNELIGKLIGRDKEFFLMGDKLAPLLMVPHGDETRKEYYIDDSVVNTFFKLLKKRSDRFPKAYINHYSFDSQIATSLIQGSRSEHEVLAWFKAEKLRGAHKLFLPLCLSAHWVLFYVNTKEKKISWLDSNPSTRIMSNNVEKQTILQWFTTFLLPEFGYYDANEWPFLVRTDIPVQKNWVDCGVFVMKYGDCLTHGDFFPFTQNDMVHFRRRIFLDIYRGRLHGKIRQV